jgi:hypothetical protein
MLLEIGLEVFEFGVGEFYQRSELGIREVFCSVEEFSTKSVLEVSTVTRRMLPLGGFPFGTFVLVTFREVLRVRLAERRVMITTPVWHVGGFPLAGPSTELIEVLLVLSEDVLFILLEGGSR